jgi:RiboL-PSP-HEPN
MANSSEYILLSHRINDLEAHLLPAINPTLSYTAQENDLTRSYCLLCHAEVEAYIESVILNVTTIAFNKWQANKTLITPMIFHLAYNYKHTIGKPKEPPYSMVGKSFSALQQTIKSNNGVKEDNLNLMLKPIGFDMDPVLMTTLTNFGQTRGQIAHSSFQTQQPLDPATEKNRVTQIVTALSIFDSDLVDYEQNGTQNRTPKNMAWDKLGFWDRIKILFS